MPEKKDTHAFVFSESNRRYVGLNINGKGFSEAGKASNLSNVTIEDCVFSGGYEDNFDAVRGSNYIFRNCVFKDPDLQNVTLKGGIDGIRFESCSFLGEPNIAHVVLGQYSDYDLCGIGPTRRIEFQNCFTDQAKLSVILWNAERPSILRGKVSIKKVPKFIVFFYFTFRKIQQRIRYGKSGRGDACNRL